MPADWVLQADSPAIQSRPHEKGKSIFVDADFRFYEDRLAYLSQIGGLSRSELPSQFCGFCRRRRITSHKLHYRQAAAKNQRTRACSPNSSTPCWAITSTATGRPSRKSWRTASHGWLHSLSHAMIPSVPIKMRHLAARKLPLRARKGDLAHAHAADID
jgi:hypothetical protein